MERLRNKKRWKCRNVRRKWDRWKRGEVFQLWGKSPKTRMTDSNDVLNNEDSAILPMVTDNGEVHKYW